MGAAGINDENDILPAQLFSRNRTDDRCCGIFEVNSHKSAYRRSCLVHQATGLAEIMLFGILTDLCQCHRRMLTITEQTVEHFTIEHFEGSR